MLAHELARYWRQMDVASLSTSLLWCMTTCKNYNGVLGFKLKCSMSSCTVKYFGSTVLQFVLWFLLQYCNMFQTMFSWNMLLSKVEIPCYCKKYGNILICLCLPRSRRVIHAKKFKLDWWRTSSSKITVSSKMPHGWKQFAHGARGLDSISTLRDGPLVWVCAGCVLCCTVTRSYNILLYYNFIPTTLFVQVLDLVDEKTRKNLEAAPDTKAINEILDRPTTKWMTHARCLRHPMNAHGCPLPMDSDIEPLFKSSLLFGFY